MSKVQNLGIITSYGYAIAGGYVGTVEDYERYLANLPNYTDRAETSANNAAASATSAANSASSASTYSKNSKTYRDNASTYATNASNSATAAASSATAASNSATAANTSATNAAASATAARNDANTAHDNAQTAIQNAQLAATSATNSASSASSAATHATNAKTSENTAKTYKNNAATSATAAASSAILSQSWAEGGTGTRSGENTNNAKYWSQQAQAIVGLSDFVGATSQNNGVRGLVPAPSAGRQYAFLRGDGVWANSTSGTASNVVYENTDSKLTATDVQAAIDEVYTDEKKAYKKSDSVETVIDSGDYIPFYDVSASATKRITKGNLITVDTALSSTSTNPVQNKAINTALSNKADKSSIPTVNNATITIQKNGTNVDSFTTNQASGKSININVPTKVSELSNDSGYTTNTGTVTQVKINSTAYNPTNGVITLPAYPTVPTVNNATITIQKNGTNVDTFTVNQSSNKIINIPVAKADVGLSNVGNFLAVSTVASQGLSATLQANARANIGLGDAAVKGVDTTVSTSTNLVTSAAVNTALGNKANKPTVKSATLAAGSTTVTFSSLPTSGNYMIDFFTSNGVPFKGLNVATAGKAILTFDAQSVAITVYCRIEEVQ